MARYSLRGNTALGQCQLRNSKSSTTVCDSRLQLLLHLGELLLGHGAFSLTQLLQFLSGGVKVWPGGCRGDLRQQFYQSKVFLHVQAFCPVNKTVGLTMYPAYSSFSTNESCSQMNSSCCRTTENSFCLKFGSVLCRNNSKNLVTF